jgi:hypothetical protein
MTSYIVSLKDGSKRYTPSFTRLDDSICLADGEIILKLDIDIVGKANLDKRIICLS